MCIMNLGDLCPSATFEGEPYSIASGKLSVGRPRRSASAQNAGGGRARGPDVAVCWESAGLKKGSDFAERAAHGS